MPERMLERRTGFGRNEWMGRGRARTVVNRNREELERLELGIKHNKVVLIIDVERVKEHCRKYSVLNPFPPVGFRWQTDLDITELPRADVQESHTPDRNLQSSVHRCDLCFFLNAGESSSSANQEN